MGVVLFGILTPRPTHSTIKYENKIEPYVVAQNPVEIPHLKVYNPIRGNCVRFARQNRPDLKMGLYTLQAKKNIVRTSKPYENAIAVTAESSAGHLSVVIAIEKDYIKVRESGYGRGITERWIPKEKVIGYF